MQRIYSHQDIGMVHLVMNELENCGIETEIRGEHLAAVAGGGADMTAWFQLWVLDDDRHEEAEQVVQAFIENSALDAPGSDESWTCPDCAEVVEAPLAKCWNCGREQPEPVA